jgi:hypothetical protein
MDTACLRPNWRAIVAGSAEKDALKHQLFKRFVSRESLQNKLTEVKNPVYTTRLS